jgi:NitT/TauT family transport system permease protein
MSRLLVLVAVLALWEGAVRVFHVPAIVVPPPSAVLVALWTGLSSGEWTEHLLVTLWEILAGFLLGSAWGLVLGFAIALFPTAERLLYPYVVAFQTVPKVAIAPIMVIWFGYGLSSKIIITATIAFFPLLANTITGLHAASREQIEMLQAYTASRAQIFRMVRLPGALPYIFTGLDIAIVLSVIGAIVGEFVGAQAGLGYLILQKNFNFDMAGTFAILVILSAIGTALHALVSFAHRRVVFWVDHGHDLTTGA